MATKKKMGELADERGHTIADAKRQEPTLDLGEPAASQVTPEGANTMVLAQTPEEVAAQVDNEVASDQD